MLKKRESFDCALLNYRNTPPKEHTYSLTQRMLYRCPRMLLPMSDALLSPRTIDVNTVLQEIRAKWCSSKQHYDKSATQANDEVDVGSFIYAKPLPHRRGKPWQYDKVVQKDSHRSYMVDTHGSTIRRNRIHIKPATPPPYTSTSSMTAIAPSTTPAIFPSGGGQIAKRAATTPGFVDIPSRVQTRTPDMIASADAPSTCDEETNKLQSPTNLVLQEMPSMSRNRGTTRIRNINLHAKWLCGRFAWTVNCLVGKEKTYRFQIDTTWTVKHLQSWSVINCFNCVDFLYMGNKHLLF